MAKLSILLYPDSRLHTVAAPVDRIDDEIRNIIKDMSDTMYAAPGVGLAATQVNVHRRIVIVDISPARDQLHAFVNPEIVESTGVADCEEGCLSVPGVYEKVKRAQHIRVRALGTDGQLFEHETEGLEAVCIQHEMDHLDGKVFVEKLSRLKQQRILARIKKRQREGK
ncbi:MAG TPA: peptide deformylase [Burkholderiales bacterium]|nr:peptide deformylase [Burkholderiales bacterium]